MRKTITLHYDLIRFRHLIVVFPKHPITGYVHYYVSLVKEISVCQANKKWATRWPPVPLVIFDCQTSVLIHPSASRRITCWSSVGSSAYFSTRRTSSTAAPASA